MGKVLELKVTINNVVKILIISSNSIRTDILNLLNSQTYKKCIKRISEDLIYWEVELPNITMYMKIINLIK